MKNLLIINLFLFTSSSKKLIFVFILLLILPLTGCKSVVKETVVEEPVVVVEKNGKGVLYKRFVNGEWGWYTKEFVKNESRNEKKNRWYVGEIKNGLPNGQGRYYQIAGWKYVGEWKDGKKHGQGTFTYLDDFGKYVGEFKNDKRHGQGTYYQGEGPFKGEWYEGEFKDGTLWNGASYDKDGIITGKRVNGKDIEQ